MPRSLQDILPLTITEKAGASTLECLRNNVFENPNHLEFQAILHALPQLQERQPDYTARLVRYFPTADISLSDMLEDERMNVLGCILTLPAIIAILSAARVRNSKLQNAIAGDRSPLYVVTAGREADTPAILRLTCTWGGEPGHKTYSWRPHYHGVPNDTILPNRSLLII